MKSIFTFVFTIAYLVISSDTVANTCEEQSSPLQADYTITNMHQQKIISTTALSLLRAKNRVAHRYPASQITEAWYLTSHSRIMPTRYFDAHNRAIEYSPTESVHGKKETDWSYRFQLVSDDLLNSMTKVSQTGQGCDVVETYQLKSENTQLSISWKPDIALVTKYELKKGMHTERWQLQQLIQSSEPVTALFSRVDQYQTTDFADIGDDHTDPFLTKMVTLGFIEKGASGFYDDKGNPLRADHQHH
ncbi:hypothetical protein [Aliiglaciecola sp. LCG003]|uniref:hypothetical protein n=1 Tax=Aliiglaciecola sp. LCG003 TaxID=3053655 RepID=UPI002574007E|nr:hypothetical protein [Aliiglaciecola sp. LCG003]WJG10641.1 hypothetical protein QR722_06255 [Aliiglaciecola sp. LCG003]